MTWVAIGVGVVAVVAWGPVGGREVVAPGAMATGIDSALAASADGWNRLDLDRFMGVYLDSHRTTYATATGYLHGRAAIRAYYAPRFTPETKRTHLDLVDVEIDSLSPVVASVMAFYVLKDHDSTVARGPTSLVMQRVGHVWYIVHDHSN